MRVLADENLDGPLVAWLRAHGHDVVWAAEQASGTPDAGLIELAVAQQRVIVTADRDFGELVFRYGLRPPGLVLLRLRSASATELVRLFSSIWPTAESRALGHFVVLTRTRVRVRAL